MSRWAAASAESSVLHRAIVRYYERTWLDYRLAWFGSEDLAFHFGYHDAEHVSHHAALLNSNRVLADLAGIAPGDRVLDAGCAVGGSSAWLASHRGASVVGITIVPSQVELARRLVRKRGLEDRVRFELADYCATPYPDASFDCAWALESLCHASNKSDFYREMARVIRPGGRLVVAEYMRTARPLSPAGEAMMRLWLDGWTIPDLDTPEEHACAARAAGFGDVAVRDGTPLTRPSLARLHRRAIASYPIDFVLCRLGLRTAVQHGNVVASLYQYRALRCGYWSYRILTATRGDPPARGAGAEAAS